MTARQISRRVPVRATMMDETSNSTSELSTGGNDTGRSRFQIGITYGLLASFGGLVLLGVLSVLGLGMWSARQNTIGLLADISLATKEIVFARLEQHLTPAEYALRHLGQQLQDGRIDADDETEIGQYLSGALAATPQIRSIVYITEQARMIFALRQERGVEVKVVDVAGMPVIMKAVEEAREQVDVFWADVIRPETAEATLLNVRYPVLLSDGSLGVLAATVQIDQLSRILDSTARTLGGHAFVLYDRQFVLAHPRFIGGVPGLTSEHILPTLEEVDDPLIRAVMERQSTTHRMRFLEEATGIRMVTAGDNDWAVVSSDVDRFGTKPWQIVVAFPAADFEEEFKRLRWAAGAGLGVLLITLVLAYLLARYLSAPIDRLAVAAKRVRELSLDNVPPLNVSLFREVSSASEAFNSMIAGLKWFELYLPQKLVRRLMQASETDITQSQQREMTIMFTDIWEFTSMSSAMSAEDTAEFLNSHFEMLGGQVESEGGTIDKFIGDALMAFWNAPDDQPDHAVRACRAALAIRIAVTLENQHRRERGLTPVRVRIGIHTGEVIVGNIGAPGRINYTIVGDAVNTANRIEQLGKEVDSTEDDVVILASAATMNQARSSVEGTAIGRHSMRGLVSEIEIFRL